MENENATWKYFCYDCDYGTNVKRSLTRHFITHGIGERFQCDQCDKDFTQKVSLSIHLRTHDGTAKRFSCQICDQQFTRKSSLKTHTLEIHEKKAIPCDQCFELFGSVNMLNQHKRNEHVSINCGQCNQKVMLGTFARHIKLMHKITEKFNCHICEYVANRKGNLKRHIEQTHDKKKNWICKACPYSCYEKANFVRHWELIHTGESEESPMESNLFLSVHQL